MREGKIPQTREITHCRKVLLPGLQENRWPGAFATATVTHRTGAAHVVRSETLPSSRPATRRSQLTMWRADVVCPLATHLVVGDVIQRQTPTDPNCFKLSRSEGPSGYFIGVPGHLGTSRGGNLLMLGARRCAKPIPICYFLWTPAATLPERSYYSLPTGENTEAQGGGGTRPRSRRWEALGPELKQDNDIVRGGLGAFRGRHRLQQPPFSTTPK